MGAKLDRETRDLYVLNLTVKDRALNEAHRRSTAMKVSEVEYKSWFVPLLIFQFRKREGYETVRHTSRQCLKRAFIPFSRKQASKTVEFYLWLEFMNHKNPMTNGSNLEKLLIIRYPVLVPLVWVSCFSALFPWGSHSWTCFQLDEHFNVFLYWAQTSTDVRWKKCYYWILHYHDHLARSPTESLQELIVLL